jgi:hypothetical protein
LCITTRVVKNDIVRQNPPIKIANMTGPIIFKVLFYIVWVSCAFFGLIVLSRIR